MASADPHILKEIPGLSEVVEACRVEIVYERIHQFSRRLISPSKYFTCGRFCFHDCRLQNTKSLHESVSPTSETRRKRGTHLRTCLSLPVGITLLLSMFLVCSVCLSVALLRANWFHKFLSLGLKLGLRHTQGEMKKKNAIN